MKKILQVLFIVTTLLAYSITTNAQTMGKQFEVSMTLVEWNAVLFPKSAVLSDAKSIRITVTNCNYVKLLNGSTQMAERTWDNGKATAVFNLSGTDLSVAKNEALYIHVGGNTSDSKVLVTNYDTEDGAANDTGTSVGGGNNTGGNNTGGDNTGGDNTGGDNTGNNNTGNNNTGGGNTNTTPLSSEVLATKIGKTEQLTNLATVYLTVPDALNADGTRIPINTVLENNDGVYHAAAIQVIDNGTDGTGTQIVSFTEPANKLSIKVRGNETAKGSKKPYRMKFAKDDKDSNTGEVTASHKHDMFGRGNLGYSKRNWVLLANQKDPTLMHNALAYTIGKAVGMEFCPGYKFVDLVINGEYRGNYMISDHCEVDENRINVDANNGWYLEGNGNMQWEEPFVNPTGLYISIKSPEPDANSAEETQLKNDVLNYFNNCTALFDIWDAHEMSEEKQAALTNPNTGWRKYWDEESLVNYYIGVNVTGNHDGFMTVKMYRNPGEKVKFGPLWDFDTSYGDYDDGTTLSEDAQPGSPIFCNFIHKLVQYDPVFVKKIHDKLHEVVTAGLENAMLAEINKLEPILAQSQATENPNQQSGAYAASVAALRTYVKTHLGWLVETIDAKYTAMGGDNIQNNNGGNEEPGGEEGEGGNESGEGGEDTPTNGAKINVDYVVTGMSLSAWQNEMFPAEAFLKDAEYADITISVDPTIHSQFYAALRLNGEDIQVHNQGWQIYTYTFRISGEVLTAAANGQLYLRTGGGGGYTIVVRNVSSSSPGTETPDTPTTPDTPSTETFTQLTDLPTMYLQIYKLNEDGTSDKTQTEIIKTSGGDYHTARIVIVDKNNTIKERDEETQIRGRGNSTWSGDNLKNPYRLKFPAKTKLLSYLAEDGTTVVNNYANAKSWTLLSNKGDYSLIRNALTAELGKYMNMPFVPAYKFVDLVINGNYAGTYQISDQIQVAKDRINVNSDTGWLLSANRGGGYEEDPYFTAGGATFNIKNPEADTPTASGVTTDTKYDAMKTWMADALATPYVNGANRLNEETLAAKFDMESLANYIIGIDITGDPDGAIDNFYMYKEADESSKMKFGPMWDYDLAYGNVSSRDHKESHFFADETYGWGYKVKQIYNTPTAIKAIWKRWKTVYGEYDSATKQSTLTKYLLAKVDELDAIIAQSQAKNFTENKVGSVAGSNTYASHAEAIAALKAWIPTHIEWLNTAYKTDYATITGLDPDAVVDNPEPSTPERAQLTNLPTIYLDAETINGDWQQAAIEVFDKDNKLYQGATWKKEGVSKKGNIIVSVQYQGSGADNSKNSYRLKFNDKINLLTADGAYKQWVLMSNDDDPSMINNALAKELGDAVGMPWTPGYQFVDLYVNNTYMGTYQVSDRVKAEPGRALVSGGNKDYDWHVQFDDNGEIKENDNSTYIAATETTPNIVIKNPDADDITVEQLATLKADMQDYFLNTFFVDIKNNVDREQLINWYICQEILCSYKGLSSIEVYRSITSTAADNKVHFGPLWDSEKAFGNAPKHPIDMSDKNTEGSHDGLITKYADYKVMKKILKALWKETWFKEGVIAKWKTLYGAEKTTDLLATLKGKAAEISGTLTESQAKNAALWPTSLDYGTTDKYFSYADAVKHVTDYLDERFEYLDVKFAELSKYSIIDLIRLIDDLNNEQQDADINDIETIKNKILNN